MNKCAQVRDHIRAHPGCTYQDIAAGIGIASGKFIKDIRKMVERGLIVCEERDGVRYHTIGREPARTIGLTAGELRRRKLDQQKQHRSRPEVRERRNARRRKGVAPRCWTNNPRIADHTLARYTAPTPEPIRAQTVDEFLARGGRIERLPGPWDRVA